MSLVAKPSLRMVITRLTISVIHSCYYSSSGNKNAKEPNKEAPLRHPVGDTSTEAQAPAVGEAQTNSGDLITSPDLVVLGHSPLQDEAKGAAPVAAPVLPTAGQRNQNTGVFSNRPLNKQLDGWTASERADLSRYHEDEYNNVMAVNITIDVNHPLPIKIGGHPLSVEEYLSGERFKFRDNYSDEEFAGYLKANIRDFRAFVMSTLDTAVYNTDLPPVDISDWEGIEESIDISGQVDFNAIFRALTTLGACSPGVLYSEYRRIYKICKSLRNENGAEATIAESVIATLNHLKRRAEARLEEMRNRYKLNATERVREIKDTFDTVNVRANVIIDDSLASQLEKDRVPGWEVLEYDLNLFGIDWKECNTINIPELVKLLPANFPGLSYERYFIMASAMRHEYRTYLEDWTKRLHLWTTEQAAAVLYTMIARITIFQGVDTKNLHWYYNDRLIDKSERHRRRIRVQYATYLLVCRAGYRMRKVCMTLANELINERRGVSQELQESQFTYHAYHAGQEQLWATMQALEPDLMFLENNIFIGIIDNADIPRHDYHNFTKAVIEGSRPKNSAPAIAPTPAVTTSTLMVQRVPLATQHPAVTSRMLRAAKEADIAKDYESGRLGPTPIAIREMNRQALAQPHVSEASRLGLQFRTNPTPFDGHQYTNTPEADRRRESRRNHGTHEVHDADSDIEEYEGGEDEEYDYGEVVYTDEEVDDEGNLMDIVAPSSHYRRGEKSTLSARPKSSRRYSRMSSNSPTSNKKARVNMMRALATGRAVESSPASSSSSSNPVRREEASAEEEKYTEEHRNGNGQSPPISSPRVSARPVSSSSSHQRRRVKRKPATYVEEEPSSDEVEISSPIRYTAPRVYRGSTSSTLPATVAYAPIGVTHSQEVNIWTHRNLPPKIKDLSIPYGNIDEHLPKFEMHNTNPRVFVQRFLTYITVKKISPVQRPAVFKLAVQDEQLTRELMSIDREPNEKQDDYFLRLLNTFEGYFKTNRLTHTKLKRKLTKMKKGAKESIEQYFVRFETAWNYTFERTPSE